MPGDAFKPQIKEHLEEYGIPFDAINENPYEAQATRKLYADVYVDDRGLRFNGVAQGLAQRVMDARQPWHKKTTL